MFIDTTHRLFRESTRSVKGSIVKVGQPLPAHNNTSDLSAIPQDLSLLNRDLSKLIVVDTDADHVALQLDNAIIPPKWDGSRGDRGLIALIPFLECLSFFNYYIVPMLTIHYSYRDIQATGCSPDNQGLPGQRYPHRVREA